MHKRDGWNGQEARSPVELGEPALEIGRFVKDCPPGRELRTPERNSAYASKCLGDVIVFSLALVVSSEQGWKLSEDLEILLTLKFYYLEVQDM